jgi:hypothetical protein
MFVELGYEHTYKFGMNSPACYIVKNFYGMKLRSNIRKFNVALVCNFTSAKCVTKWETKFISNRINFNFQYI